MKEALAYVFLGLGTGGFYALLATGIIVGFKGSGVINFAHAAIASYVAFQYTYLRKEGLFVLPWVDIVPTHDLNLPVKLNMGGTPMGTVGAFFWAMVTAIGLGALAHFLVFRPLRNAAPLGKVIGSLGLMNYLLAVMLLNFGVDTPTPDSVLPQGLFNNFLGLGKAVTQEQFFLAVSAIVVGAAVWAFYRFSRVGLATRAAAGNEKGATLLGFAPERLALYNWILSAGLAGLAGILVGNITGTLTVSKFTGLIVAAFAAALIGKLTSVPIAVMGGLAIGVVESWSGTWLAQETWFPKWIPIAAVKEGLPFLVIVAVLFLQGKSLPIRGTVEEKRLPISPTPKRVWQHSLIWTAGAFFLSVTLTGNWQASFTVSLIAAMICLSYVVLTGYVGQISLMQLTIAGIAAFVMARLMSDGKKTVANLFAASGPDWPWPIAAVLGIVAAMIVGVLLGLPALRIRGVQLAVITMAAGLFMTRFYFENEKFTGLSAGSPAKVDSPTFFGTNLGSRDELGQANNKWFPIFCAVVLILLCLLVANLRRAGIGRRMLAVRANERGAASAGIDVTRTKILAFAVSSFIAGVAGIMTGFRALDISSANFTFGASLGLLAFAYLGGITSINGSLIGGAIAGSGIIAAFGDWHVGGLSDYVTLLGGAGMIFTAIHQPAGISLTFQPGLQYLGNFLVKATPANWLTALKRIGPGFIVTGGIMVAWINWKAEDWRIWHIPLVIVGGLLMRSIALQIYRAIARKPMPAPQLAGMAAGGH
jgi:branched-chain amino acid transport system permease protein